MNMNIENFDDLANFMDKLKDDFFWKPVNSDKESLDEFNKLLQDVKDSQNWGKELNTKKGKVLEDFSTFLFKRFQDTDVKKNYRPADNESDLEVHLSEKIRPSFMNDYIGPKIIAECKNKKSNTIDVGTIVKLAELIPVRAAEFGVFISINGIGGYGWRYGEGKRKKILFRDKIPIISFKVSELEKLIEGKNFYTMIKEKVFGLYDEVDDDSPDVPPTGHMEYTKRMLEVISHLSKCSIMTEEETERYKTKITSKYGLDE